jgi:hypothetical protein
MRIKRKKSKNVTCWRYAQWYQHLASVERAVRLPDGSILLNELLDCLMDPFCWMSWWTHYVDWVVRLPDGPILLNGLLHCLMDPFCLTAHSIEWVHQAVLTALQRNGSIRQSNSSFIRMGPSTIERELQVLVWQTITLVFEIGAHVKFVFVVYTVYMFISILYLLYVYLCLLCTVVYGLWEYRWLIYNTYR